MAQIYANLIKLGMKTIDDVPYSLKNDVIYIINNYKNDNN